MAMMNAEQYRDSLARRKPLKVYLDGKLLANPLEHPYIRTSMNSVALTYELAQDPEHKNLMTAKSALTGQTINRFTHIHQSADDLVKKVKLLRAIGQQPARASSAASGWMPSTRFTSPPTTWTRNWVPTTTPGWRNSSSTFRQKT